MQLNRRDWLRAGLFMSAGIATMPSGHCEPWLDPAEANRGWVPKGGLKARLSANENPYGPSPGAVKVIGEAAPDGYLYAMEYSRKFKTMVAAFEGVPEDHVLLGAGSGELLMAAALWAAYRPGAGRTILAPDPTFDALPRSAVKHGLTMDKVPLVATDGYDINLNKLNDRITAQTGMVYLCNPNNPTAITVEPAKLRSFIGAVAAKTPVFVDEAYIDYTPNPAAYTMVDQVKKGENVIVTKTFSKVHGFAGLRIGYMIAKPELIEQIGKFVTGGSSISITSVRAALASMPDKEFVTFSLGKTQESKAYLYQQLKPLGYEPLPSGANFVMFPIRMKGEDFVAKMMERGVGIRQWKFDGQYWCRVSLGTMDQMKYFTGALTEIS